MKVRLIDPDFGAFTGSIIEGTPDSDGDIQLPDNIKSALGYRRTWALSGDWEPVSEEEFRIVVSETKVFNNGHDLFEYLATLSEGERKLVRPAVLGGVA